MRLTLIAAAFVAFASQSGAQVTQISMQSSSDAATYMCSVIDQTSIITQPCEVSVWDSSISVTTATTPYEAKKICNELVSFAKKKAVSFDQGWKIKIYSPYSGDKTIAFCNL